MNNAIYAAIAMAMYDNDGYNMHDDTNGKLTITAKDTEWSSKGDKMTQKP